MTIDFTSLVLSLLNESPDGLEFEGKEYYFDEPQGNPITLAITNLMIVPDMNDSWNEKKQEPNSYDSGLGRVLIYGKMLEDSAPWTHDEMLSELNGLPCEYVKIKQQLNIGFFSPRLDINKYLTNLTKKHPAMTVYADEGADVISPTLLGRMWKVNNKIIVSMWDPESDVFEKFVVPFIKTIYPTVSPDNIMIEDEVNETFYPSSNFSVDKFKRQPHEKEIADLLRQLHLASGNQQKKNEITKKIVEICKKFNINPEKYGISDEVLKGSMKTAQKLLGKSKDTVASLKSRMQTSESLQY